MKDKWYRVLVDKKTVVKRHSGQYNLRMVCERSNGWMKGEHKTHQEPRTLDMVCGSWGEPPKQDSDIFPFLMILECSRHGRWVGMPGRGHCRCKVWHWERDGYSREMWNSGEKLFSKSAWNTFICVVCKNAYSQATLSKWLRRSGGEAPESEFSPRSSPWLKGSREQHGSCLYLAFMEMLFIFTCQCIFCQLLVIDTYHL